MGIRICLMIGLACSVAAGCYPPLPGEVYERDGQAEAAKVVWNDTYGMTEKGPVVHWLTGAELTCTDNGIPGYAYDGACDGGLTSPDGVAVTWPDGSVYYSASAFAHEFAHYKACVGGDDDCDHDHRGAAFQPGGLVDQANAALVAAGM